MKIDIKNNKKLTSFLLAGAITLSTVTITGCIPKTDETSNTKQEPPTPEVVEYDIVDSSDIKEAFKTQVIDVPGEDFKLIIEYRLDPETEKEWHTTADKKIYTTVYTEGLSNNTKVYIDNIHTDVKLISTYPEMNGITQDSIDDEIHKFYENRYVRSAGSRQGYTGQEDCCKIWYSPYFHRRYFPCKHQKRDGTWQKSKNIYGSGAFSTGRAYMRPCCRQDPAVRCRKWLCS